MSAPEGLNHLMRWLTGSVVVSLIALAALVVFGAPLGTGISVADGACVLVAVAAGFVFYVVLGVMARRLGKSWITWVGLALITNPVGWLVAYVKMWQLVCKARRAEPMPGS